MKEVVRCPECSAQVVDRRFANCTTCHAPLPVEWIMTPEQIKKVEALDQAARKEYTAEMEFFDPCSNNVFLRRTNSSGF